MGTWRRVAAIGAAVAIVAALGSAAAATADVSSWSIVKSPTPNGDAGLSDVSCVSASWCLGVGGTTGHVSFAERWNGRTWSVVRLPGTPDVIVERISCVSTTFCAAIGGTRVGLDSVPAAEMWDGSSWSVHALRSATSAGFSDVSCVRTTSCMAVGSGVTDHNGRRVIYNFAARWDGRRWSAVATPKMAGATQNYLNSVSCTAVTQCFAVGVGFPQGVAVALIERWDGTRWTITQAQRLPNNPSLSDVACATTTDCIAVGWYVGEPPLYRGQTLAEHWDGKDWSVIPSGNPTTDDYLYGVSCPTTTRCVAVGLRWVHTKQTSGELTLIEQWDGTNWSVMPSPNRDTTNGLFGVSCIATMTCHAVGGTARSDAPGATVSTLVESYP